ncbi:MAG: enoyl-CoA hydratase/isomerase family protein [Myxococcota bacterium]|nr:enoyl-CoA hydratase/isomerase family protein [Myxococcota bacterium]MEC8423781.1 enoyl-CoA hydratase/isomerase family protein [Myxococcota bacterium]
MRAFETLSYDEDGALATVTLQQPRIDMRMVRELTAVCDHLEDDSGSRIVVFRAAGEDFLLGIDFKEFRDAKVMDIHGFNKWEKLCVRIERLPKATIAALHGRVVGGGVQLALVCDSRIAASGTTLQLDEVHHGFLPGMATFRLAKYVGLGRAKRIIMQCPELGVPDAIELGIVDIGVDDLDQGIAAEVARFGPTHAVSIQLARRLLNESYGTAFELAIGNFLAAQHRAITQSAFLDALQTDEDGRA